MGLAESRNRSRKVFWGIRGSCRCVNRHSIVRGGLVCMCVGSEYRSIINHGENRGSSQMKREKTSLVVKGVCCKESGRTKKSLLRRVVSVQEEASAKRGQVQHR